MSSVPGKDLTQRSLRDSVSSVLKLEGHGGRRESQLGCGQRRAVLERFQWVACGMAHLLHNVDIIQQMNCSSMACPRIDSIGRNGGGKRIAAFGRGVVGIAGSHAKNAEAVSTVLVEMFARQMGVART